MRPDVEEIVKYIKKMVPNYVQSWMPDFENPDFGVEFVLTFAKMFSQTLERYDKIWDKHYAVFLETLGILPLKQQLAEGFVVFQVADGAPTGSFVAEGTIVLENQNDIPFILDEPVYVTNSVIKSIYCCKDDKFYKADPQTPLIFDFDNQQNLQQHCVYIGHDYILNMQKKATLLLDIDSSENKLFYESKDNFVWEYFDGQWNSIDNIVWKDKLTLVIPSSCVPFQINDLESYFIRCRSLSLESDISVKKPSICAFAQNIPAEKIFHRDIEIPKDYSEFYPFGKTLTDADFFYIACGEVLAKKGARIDLTLQVSSHRFDTENPADSIPIKWKVIMDKHIFDPPARLDIEILDFSFEYWNGKDFVSLNWNRHNIFKAGDTFETKTISFLCPDDAQSISINGCESNWLRIRLTDISNLYKLPATYIVPFMKHPVFSYSYADFIDAQHIISENNLKFQNSFKFEKSLFSEPTILFGFDKPLGNPTKMFVQADKDICGMSFSGLTENGWKNIDSSKNWNSADCSNPNQKIFTFNIKDTLFQSELYSEKLYWVKAVCSQVPSVWTFQKIVMNIAKIIQKSEIRTKIISAGQKFLDLDDTGITDLELRMNQKPFYHYTADEIAGTVELKDSQNSDIDVYYRVSVGEGGNCDAGAITKIPQSIGYISQLFNPMPTLGGRDVESSAKIIERGAEVLRHQNRATTASDFEALAKESAGGILKCKCFENINASGHRQPGAVTIVYLPENYAEKETSVDYTAMKILTYIRDRCSPVAACGLSAITPDYMEISVMAELVCSNTQYVSEQLIEQRIEEFLNPVSGNFNKKGYSFGWIPSVLAINNFLYNMEEVRKIENLNISAYINKLEVDPSKVDKKHFILCVNGKHRITFKQ